jgi:DNA-binding PucR family transcriptional regulator
MGEHRGSPIERMLHRIEERSGWHLSDPMLRFALALAVRLVQNAQEPGRE